MRGKFKKKSGKVVEVKIKMQKIYVEGIQVKKQEGSKANVALKASNLQITELNDSDKKRMKKMKTQKVEKSTKTAEEKKKWVDT